ncbi:MAG: DUF5685 family protein [Planctomycetaceae bacterium]|nr:DUF5685 family protein [Planctomycetaceae bacterium]
MIGTIKPSWKELKCNGLHQDVANSMCRTCAALGNKGILARPLLSFEAIFLSLFSQDEQFVESRLRYRPFQCVMRNKQPSQDGEYLANISAIIAAAKLDDDIHDKNTRPTRFQRKIKQANQQALEALDKSGFPVAELQQSLSNYRSIEETLDTGSNFNSISQPIANAYGLVFSHLPSRQECDTETMFAIGQDFGRATLLIDAVNDVEEDAQTGSFNAWQAAMDIPKDLESARCRVAGILDSLQDRSAHLSDMAASYIKSAEGFILPDLGMPKPQRGGLASYLLPSALFAQPGDCPATPPEPGSKPCSPIEQNCDGTLSITAAGWLYLFIAAGLIVGGVFCKMWDKKD